MKNCTLLYNLSGESKLNTSLTNIQWLGEMKAINGNGQQSVSSSSSTPSSTTTHKDIRVMASEKQIAQVMIIIWYRSYDFSFKSSNNCKTFLCNIFMDAFKMKSRLLGVVYCYLFKCTHNMYMYRATQSEGTWQNSLIMIWKHLAMITCS